MCDRKSHDFVKCNRPSVLDGSTNSKRVCSPLCPFFFVPHCVNRNKPILHKKANTMVFGRCVCLEPYCNHFTLLVLLPLVRG